MSIKDIKEKKPVVARVLNAEGSRIWINCHDTTYVLTWPGMLEHFLCFADGKELDIRNLLSEFSEGKRLILIAEHSIKGGRHIVKFSGFPSKYVDPCVFDIPEGVLIP